MKPPSKESLMEEIGKVIDLEGYAISVEVCRTVVRTSLENAVADNKKDDFRQLFTEDDMKKKFREAVEEKIKEIVLRNPSIVEELRAPQVHGGVGKKPKSGSKKRSPRKSAGTTKRAKPEPKEKGPQKPKKAQSGYMLWTATVRKQVTAENPGAKITELSKIFGKMWKKISDEERKEIDILVEKDKERYERECEEFRAKYGEDALPKTQPKRKSEGTGQRKKRPKDDDSFIRDEDDTTTSSDSSDSDSSDSDSDSSDSDSSDSSEGDAKKKEPVKPAPKTAFKPTPKTALPTKPAAKPSSPVKAAVSPQKPPASPKKPTSPTKAAASPSKAVSPKAAPKASPTKSPAKGSPSKRSPVKAD